MYLYNKNTLEYVEIVGSEPKSMILYIEGRSTFYILLVLKNCQEAENSRVSGDVCHYPHARVALSPLG